MCLVIRGQVVPPFGTQCGHCLETESIASKEEKMQIDSFADDDEIRPTGNKLSCIKK